MLGLLIPIASAMAFCARAAGGSSENDRSFNNKGLNHLETESGAEGVETILQDDAIRWFLERLPCTGVGMPAVGRRDIRCAVHKSSANVALPASGAPQLRRVELSSVEGRPLASVASGEGQPKRAGGLPNKAMRQCRVKSHS